MKFSESELVRRKKLIKAGFFGTISFYLILGIFAKYSLGFDGFAPGYGLTEFFWRNPFTLFLLLGSGGVGSFIGYQYLKRFNLPKSYMDFVKKIFASFVLSFLGFVIFLINADPSAGIVVIVSLFLFLNINHK